MIVKQGKCYRMIPKVGWREIPKQELMGDIIVSSAYHAQILNDVIMDLSNCKTIEDYRDAARYWKQKWAEADKQIAALQKYLGLENLTYTPDLVEAVKARIELLSMH